MFCPNKCQLNIALLIAMRMLFYQCVCSRCSCHLKMVGFSHAFMSKGAAGARRIIKSLMIAGCCLGSDPELSSVNRVWKMIICDLKRTAHMNIHARYVSESMHVFYYWLTRPINQRRNWIWSPAWPCLCECSLCLSGNHRKKRWEEDIAKSIKTDSMNKCLLFIAPSSVGPREYPIKLASG